MSIDGLILAPPRISKIFPRASACLWRRLLGGLGVVAMLAFSACSSSGGDLFGVKGGAPTISAFAPAQAIISNGTATTLTGTFANGTGTVDHGVGAVTSGVPQSTGNLTGDTTFTLTVTNAAGVTKTQSTTVTVVTVPIISGNAGVAGATLSYTDGSAKTATADAAGAYSFSVAYNWSGSVTASLAGYIFSPAKTYSNVQANQTAQNFTATAIPSVTTPIISGNAGVAGALITYTGGTTLADAAGAYSFSVAYNWSGSVTASLAGYTFSPAKTYSNVQANQTAQNFTATAIPPAIAPVITTAPIAITVTAGDPASFSVAFSGSPAPAIQWQRSTDNGATWANVTVGTGANSTTYTYPTRLATADADNGNLFQAIGRNGVGNPVVTVPVALTVNTPAQITGQPQSVIVDPGGKAMFTVTATGRPAPSYEWTRYSSAGVSSIVPGVKGPALTLDSVTLADQGVQFMVTVTNGIGSSVSSGTAALHINQPLTITTHPKDTEMEAGTSAFFSVVASSYPVPEYQWQTRSGASGTWTNISATNPSAKTAELVFPNALITNDGDQFLVIVKNDKSSLISTPATLHVTQAPTVTNPANSSVAVGETASFTVTVTGRPAPTLSLQRCRAGGTNWIEVANVTLASGSQTLRYVATAEDDQAKFQFIATNKVRSAPSQSAMLTVTYKPVFTSQPQSTVAIEDDQVVLMAAAKGNPALGPLQWQKDTGTGFQDIVGATGNNYNVTAKASVNSVRYRAKATNSGGDTFSETAKVTAVSIYLVGTDSKKYSPIAWVNGSLTPLSNAGNDLGGATTVVKVGSDLYIGGVSRDASYNTIPGYWKNGIWIGLPPPGGQNTADVNALVISNGDVYAIGERQVGTNPMMAGYWKGQVWNPLPGLFPNLNNRGNAGVLVGSTLYVAGASERWSNGHPFYSPGIWKGTDRTDLPSLDANHHSHVAGMAVLGSDVYIAGDSADASGKTIPGFWKNDTWVPLPSGTEAITVSGMVMVGEDIYTVGKRAPNAGYWISKPNGQSWDHTWMSLPTPTEADYGVGTSIQVYMGSVFVGGYAVVGNNTIPGYWINQKWVPLYVAPYQTNPIGYGLVKGIFVE